MLEMKEEEEKKKEEKKEEEKNQIFRSDLAFFKKHNLFFESDFDIP